MPPLKICQQTILLILVLVLFAVLGMRYQERFHLKINFTFYPEAGA